MTIENQPVPPRSDEAEAHAPRPGTKKAQILALYTAGLTDVGELSQVTASKPSYVAAVLQAAGRLSGYFDLYTGSAHPMNVYSKYFTGKLGFRDEEAARRSIALIDELHRHFAERRDRAGQHHALTEALVMLDRARWSGKRREAAIFRDWLVAHLGDEDGGDALH